MSIPGVVLLASLSAAPAGVEVRGPAQLRDQLEEAVRRAPGLEVVPGGARVVLEGEVAGPATLQVRLLDGRGELLWTRALPLDDGRLSSELVLRLSRALRAAVDQTSPPTPWSVLAVSAGPRLTWRWQCARPGAASCVAADALMPRPLGQRVDFGSPVPFVGAGLQVEVSPLAALELPWVRGLGLLAAFDFNGLAAAEVRSLSTQGSSPVRRVEVLDVAWAVALRWRVPFAVSWTDAGPGFVGLRVGMDGRRLSPAAAEADLPAAVRTGLTALGAPALGLEARLPLHRALAVEAAAQLLVEPRLSADTVRRFGESTSSVGFHLELGVTGHVAGPLGYFVRARYTQYVDRLSGAGEVWSVCNAEQCGGVWEERFVTASAGVVFSL